MKVLVCAVLILLSSARNSWARQQSGADVAASAERGRKEFVQSCGFCHGADATGARGPDLMRSPLVAHDVKGDQIGPVIRQGRPDKGMPAMPLSDAHILDIAAFLHARAAEAMRSSGVPKVYPAEKLLTGNVEAGKTFSMAPAAVRSAIPSQGTWPAWLVSTLQSSWKRGCFIREGSTAPR